MYFCFRTDCHNAASMPNLIRGLEITRQLVGREAIDALTIQNPRLLPSERVPAAGPSVPPAAALHA